MKIQLEADAPTRAGYSTPSRLVNLHLHDSDLAALKNAPETPEKAPAPEEKPAEKVAAKPEKKVVKAKLVDAETEPASEPVKVAIEPKAEPKPEPAPQPEPLPAPKPVDTIAETASEAIASIRTTTDSKDIATQITALKQFAENIKDNPELPEMNELSETIDKFVTIAEKSTGVKLAKQKAAKASAKKAIAAKKTTSATKPATQPAPKAVVKVAKPSTKTVKPLKSTKRKPTNIPHDKDLAAALRSVATMDEPTPTPKMKKQRHPGRFFLALSCAAACVAAIVYFVGTNIPDISVRVAALQTGVEASYPSYIPRDFSLKGINSEDGKITLTFAGPDNASFTLIEEKSSWDSAALERNYVKPTWDSNYTTTHEQGITIFTYGSNAAWVNGGVLYKINSDSNTLTKKQLRNIVTSMQ